MPTLEKLLQLLPVSPTRFVTVNAPIAPPGARATFGGTLVAQSLLASLHTVARDFEPSSVHCYFLVGGDTKERISYEVERLRRGRNFEHREIRAFQHGKLIFVSSVLFHRARASDVKPPHDDHVTETLRNSFSKYEQLQDMRPLSEFVDAGQLFSSEVCDHLDHFKHVSKAFRDPKQVAAIEERFAKGAVQYRFPRDIFRSCDVHTQLDYYQRIRPDHVAEALKKDPRFNYVAFAYLSDAYLLLTLPYFHQLPLYSHNFSVSLDHVIHFHSRPSVCEWMALRVKNPRSSGDRHIVDGSYYDAETQNIVASVRQEGLVVYDEPKKIRARF